jgi:hypothetical protein
MSVEIENRTGRIKPTSGVAPAVARKANVRVLSMLAIFAAIFAIGATSWAGFANGLGVPIGLFTQTDYVAIAIGQRIVSSGQRSHLYDFNLQLQEQQRLRAEGYLSLSPQEDQTLKYPYPYAPFIAVLWSPLVGLSPLSGMALWDLLNLAAYVGGLVLLLYSLALSRIARLLLLLGAITCFPLIVNLEQGQSSGLIMFSLAAGVALLKRGRDLPAGLAFGLLFIKIQWLPIIAFVLLIKRRWWTLLGMSVTGAAMVGITVLTIGTAWIPDYLNVVQRAQLWARDLVLDPWYSHGLSGGLTALLGRGTDELVRDLNDLALVILAVLLVFIWQGAWKPATARWDGAMAATMMAAILTNPQLNTHDICLLALPAALGISYLQGQPSEQASRQKIIWYALTWTAYLAPALFLPQVYSLPVRVTTLVMLLMLGLLCYGLLRSRPEQTAAVVPA